MKKENPIPQPPEIEELEKIFSEILNSKVVVKRDTNNKEKDKFIDIINVLQPLAENELKAYELGFDVTSLVRPYNVVIDALLVMHFGDVANELIQWYLYLRKDRYGIINPFIDNSGEEFPVETAEDLWNLIQKIGFQ